MMQRQRGTVLLVALVLSVLVIGLVIATLTTARTTNRWFAYALDQTEVLALAESATELRQRLLIDDIANFESDDVLLGDRTHTMDKAGEQLTVASSVTRQDIAGGGAADELCMTDDDGVSSFISYYQITGSASVDGGNAQVTRTIQVAKTPLFQYGVFYDDDLEVLPGPSMTLAGRIHANGSIYLNCNSTLTIDTAHMRCTGELFRGRKDSSAAPSGTVRIKRQDSGGYLDFTAAMAPGQRWNGDTCDPRYYAQYGNDASTWAGYADTRWEGTVQTQAHGVKKVAAPELQTMDPGGHYHQQAGLVIESGPAGLKAFRNSGGMTQDVTASLPAGAVAQGTMYDARQEKTLAVTDVDMGKLRDAGLMPANGLLYAYRTDSSAATATGVRLKNGKELAGPTFVVSPNPVYVQGDFNAPAAASAYHKQTAVVMCDAINLLSNAWDNTKKPGSGVPAASATTVNCAMISGIVRTPDAPDGSYSGGLENYPRFHENWSGVASKIRGSFICLFQSRYATGKWGKNNVYSPPTRDWGFDPDLLNSGSAFMKDIMPFAVYVRRLAWTDNVPSRLE